MPMKRRVPLKVLTAVLCISLTKADWCLEGSSQTFKCIKESTTIDAITWIYGLSMSLFICDKYDMPMCLSSGVSVNYSANMTSISFEYTSMFTIKSVTLQQHNTSWVCDVVYSYGLPSRVTFSLNVFEVIVKHQYSMKGTQTRKCVKLDNCGFSPVVFICLFYIQTNTSSELELKQESISYKHEQFATTGYYTTYCNYTVSAAILGPGSHKFRVVMYPNITSNITEEMKTTSPYTNSIQINYPKATLGPDCHTRDYIKENENNKCTCFDNSKSFLPTQVAWASAKSNNGTLTFTARRPSNSEMNFQCVVSNALNFTDTIIYKPMVSYPPDISLTLFNTELDMCLDSNSFISGNCVVNGGYPVSTVSIYINNHLLDENPAPDKMNQTFTSTYTFPSLVNVTCLAFNTEFSLSRARNVTIKGPPETPKVFVLVRQDTVSSPEKTQQAIIMCRSRGGFPSSKQLLLTCGTLGAQAKNSDTVTLEVNMTRTPSDLNCTCVVLHESKCLQNTTTEALRLYFVYDSSPNEINSAAIAIGVIFGLGLVALALVIIVMIRRNKSMISGGQSMEKANTQKGQDYNSIKATPYVNTEMHAYETAQIKSSYSNDVSSAPVTQRFDKPNQTIQQAEKEDHTYDEVTEIK